MKQKTRILALLLALLMAVALVGCAQEQTEEPAPTPEAGQDAEQGTEQDAEQGTEAMDVDVVIVGAGMSGLMAAYEFETAHPDVSYVVLEKLGYVTGSLPATGGIIAGINSQYHEDAGIAPATTSDFADLFEITSKTEVNRELIDNVYAHSDVVLNNLIEWGAPFITTPEAASVYSDKVYGLRTENRGSTFATFLQNKVEEDGLNILMQTTATELIVQDGAVKGVKAESKDKNYEITADYVLLATGGFGSNAEMIAEYCPAYTDAMVSSNAGATGDAIAMTEQFGTKVVGEGVMGAPTSTDGNALVTSMFLVNGKGGRFISEAEPKYVIQSEVVYNQDATAYYIVDANYSDQEQIQQKVEAGVLTPYDSLEEMAEDLGMDSATLIATVEAYNAAIDAGTDPEFGLPVAKATKIETAPFYADKMWHRFFGTIPGVEINNDCQVLNGEGAPVPGLYASGEATAGNAFTYQYPGAGIGISYAANSGRLAAENIANALQK